MLLKMNGSSLLAEAMLKKEIKVEDIREDDEKGYETVRCLSATVVNFIYSFDRRKFSESDH